MKKVLCSVALLSSLTGVVMANDIDVALEAARVIRVEKFASDAQSFNEYGTLGKVSVNKIKKNEANTILEMSYSGPAEQCDLIVAADQNSTQIIFQECSN